MVTKELYFSILRKYFFKALVKGISEGFYLSYFNGRQVAYAYKLGKVTKYSEPKSLTEFRIKSAPQSFVYIS